MNIKNRYGEWALVTGASAGIGRSFAGALAKEGVNLILAARREEELNKLKKEIESETKVTVVPVTVDLSRDDFLDVIVKKSDNRPVDILVNNAGFGTSGPFHEINGDKEVAMIKVNCIAPVVLTRHYLPGMLKKNKGAVIFLSSVAANQPSPMGITYAATKVFDDFIGEALHYEVRKTGVDVLTVKPGVTATEFQMVADYNEFKKFRTGEDVVRTALKSLGRKRVVTDGFGNKLMGLSASLLPRGIVIAVADKWTDSNRKKKN